jgi:hypothetical protein
VDRGRVKALVAPSAAQVSLENLEPVSVLFGRRIGLAEPNLELGKVMLCSQGTNVADDLADQGVFADGKRLRRDEEEKREKEEKKRKRKRAIHFGNAWNGWRVAFYINVMVSLSSAIS